jgi:hypothetical protein
MKLKQDLYMYLGVLVLLLACLAGYADPSMLVSTQSTLGGGGIYIVPLNRNFGALTVGAYTVTYTHTVYNRSPITYSFQTLTYTGTDAADWATQSNGCNSTIAPYTGTCTVEMKFVPTAVGARNATMQLPYTSSW